MRCNRIREDTLRNEGELDRAGGRITVGAPEHESVRCVVGSDVS